nr:intradiol ring-cleavage dioxygenase [Streptomyces mangrovisoli]
MTQEDVRPDGTASRRRVLAAGGAVVAGAGAGGLLATNAVAEAAPAGTADSTSTTGEVCYRLTSESIEGPYYIDADKLRTNVTEGKPGIRLALNIKVIDSETCRPLRNAAVDIWHCDALGVYSGYESTGSGGGSGGGPTGGPTDSPTDTPTGGPGGGGGGGGHQEPTDDTRYLRGTWRTDHQGRVRFQTVLPGWYQGRAVHIHTKVHVGGAWTEGGYEGGHTCHTGQFYFEEEAVLAAAELTPYSTSTVTRVTLTEDMLYDQSGATGGLLTLHYDKRRIGRGVRAFITVGVDPDATHDGDDGGFPGGGSPAPSPSATA